MKPKQKLRDLISAWQDSQVLVIGDPMKDVYHFGMAERLSPEAPVPVFVETRIEVRPGGAANVAEQVDALGATYRPHWPADDWTEKHRFLVGNHQLLRVDKDRRHAPPDELPCLNRINAIILSDYAKGWLTAKFCQELITAAKTEGIPVIVDPKGRGWNKYDGCTIICPNTAEAQNPEIVHFDRVLFKQGSRGMTLRQPGKEDHRFPATARAVFDVTGAGDTVVATLACALSVGATFEQAALMANLAAGHVVGEVGTSVCTAERLWDLIEELP